MSKKKKYVLPFFVAVTVFIGIAFGVIPLLRSVSADIRENAEYNEIREDYTLPSEETQTNDNKDNTGNGKGYSYGSARTNPDFKKLLAKNADTIGWIQIPGTPINYPVLHTSDSQKYLNMNFNGNKSVCGAIFSCGSVQYNPASQNITLFGHNLGTNRTKMFSSLVRYKNKKYYNEHPDIYFETLYQKGTYRVFSVFNVNVPGEDFNYTQSTFGSEQSFINFINTAKSKSIYDTGIEVSASDEILTLSTCDRSYDNETGRMVVMAVKIPE